MNYDYWSPFGSGENFSHQLSLIGRNTGTVVQFLAAFDGVGVLFGWFGLGTLVFILALVAKPPGQTTADRALALVVVPVGLPRWGISAGFT